MCSDLQSIREEAQRKEGLNPTLDWICALTSGSVLFVHNLNERLNPTLDWICALTLKYRQPETFVFGS